MSRSLLRHDRAMRARCTAVIDFVNHWQPNANVTRKLWGTKARQAIRTVEFTLADFEIDCTTVESTKMAGQAALAEAPVGGIVFLGGKLDLTGVFSSTAGGATVSVGVGSAPTTDATIATTEENIITEITDDVATTAGEWVGYAPTPHTLIFGSSAPTYLNVASQSDIGGASETVLLSGLVVLHYIALD